MSISAVPRKPVAKKTLLFVRISNKHRVCLNPKSLKTMAWFVSGKCDINQKVQTSDLPNFLKNIEEEACCQINYIRVNNIQNTIKIKQYH